LILRYSDKSYHFYYLLKIFTGIAMAVLGLLFLGLDAIRIYLFKRF